MLPAAANSRFGPAVSGTRPGRRPRESRGALAEWKNVLTYELGSAAVKAGIEKSKFKEHPGFSDKVAGPSC